MSRSDSKPSTLLPFALTTSAPMRSRFRVSTAFAIVASGRIVATQSPLLRRIVSTFIGYAPERGDGCGGPIAALQPFYRDEDRTECRRWKAGINGGGCRARR